MANWKSFGRVLYGCLPGDYRNRNSGLMDHVNKDHMHVNLFGKSLQANHTHAVIYIYKQMNQVKPGLGEP